MLELYSVYSSIKLAAELIWSFGWMKTIVYVSLFTYVLWIGFGLMMSLQRARDAGVLTLPAKIMGYPLLGVFIIMDAIFNFVILTIPFMEFPKIITWENWKPKINNEWLATQRLSRYIWETQPPEKPETTEQWFKMILLLYWLNAWRHWFAEFMAKNFLDPLAPDGLHCKR